MRGASHKGLGNRGRGNEAGSTVPALGLLFVHWKVAHVRDGPPDPMPCLSGLGQNTKFSLNKASDCGSCRYKWGCSHPLSLLLSFFLPLVLILFSLSCLCFSHKPLKSFWETEYKQKERKALHT